MSHISNGTRQCNNGELSTVYSFVQMSYSVSPQTKHRVLTRKITAFVIVLRPKMT